MTARRPWLLLVLLVLLGSQAGCVVRQMTIRSEPPGAMVVVNRRETGVTPVVVPSDLFVYHGDFEIFLIKDGFEPLLIKQPVPAPWYELFPFDFVSENLIPWRINNQYDFTYQLTPKRNVAPEQVLEQGNALRQRGQGIGIAPPPQPPAPPPDAP